MTMTAKINCGLADTGETPIMALFCRYQTMTMEIDNLAPGTSDAEVDASMAERDAVGDQIIALPIRGAEDLAAKMIVVRGWEGKDPLEGNASKKLWAEVMELVGM